MEAELVEALAALLSCVLAGLAALHLFWAAGGRWPGTDERSLVERVIGRTRGMRMPPAPVTAAVAAALTAGALLVAAYAGLAGSRLPAWALADAMVVMTLVFAGRGAAGYLPAFNRSRAGTPFVALNARLYSPLCLAIAAGLAALQLGR